MKIIIGDCTEVLRTLPARSVQCCVTSPPYWGLRDYGVPGQLGLEKTPEEYTARIVQIFREVRRVLLDDGTLWLNLGDSWANDTKWGGSTGGKHANELHGSTGIGRQKVSSGLKPKDLVGIPWRVAFALQADGWWLRSDIIWHKPNPMPESVTDRPTKAHEYLFLLSKSERYYYDADAIKEPATGNAHDRARKDRPDKWPNAWSAEPGRHDGIGNGRLVARLGREGRNSRMHQDRDPSHPSKRKERTPGVNPKCAAPGNGIKQNSSFSAAVTGVVETRNARSVWKIATAPFPGAHFATFPPKLIAPCILAGCPEGGVVLDPFNGAGTTGLVARQHGRHYIGIELNPAYVEMSHQRLAIVPAGVGGAGQVGHARIKP